MLKLDKVTYEHVLHRLLEERSGVLDADTVLRLWSIPEFPLSFAFEEQWIGWFRRAGYSALGGVAPRSSLRLYRGCGLERGPRGMSWEDRLEVARWHAQLAPQPAAVFAADFPAEAVLGFVGCTWIDELETFEHEYIVDPSYLNTVSPEIVETWDCGEEM